MFCLICFFFQIVDSGKEVGRMPSKPLVNVENVMVEELLVGQFHRPVFLKETIFTVRVVEVRESLYVPVVVIKEVHRNLSLARSDRQNFVVHVAVHLGMSVVHHQAPAVHQLMFFDSVMFLVEFFLVFFNHGVVRSQFHRQDSILDLRKVLCVERLQVLHEVIFHSGEDEVESLRVFLGTMCRVVLLVGVCFLEVGIFCCF